MPRKRRRLKHRRVTKQVDPFLFVIGNGTWSYFDNDDIFASKEAAEAAWNEPGMRATVWALARRLDVPDAALAYDGLQFSGYERLRTLFQVPYSLPLDVTPVLRALAQDRASIGAFERANKAAAAEIAGALDLLRSDLDLLVTIARDAHGRSDVDGYYTAVTKRLPSGARYGDSFAAA